MKGLKRLNKYRIMNTENEKIDALIREALSKEEAAYYEKLDEQNVMEQFVGLYRGKNSWLNLVVTVFILICLGIGIYSGFRFADAVSTKEMFIWSLVMGGCYLTIAMLKIWSWMQMDKGVLIREIKKLELQVSILVGSKK